MRVVSYRCMAGKFPVAVRSAVVAMAFRSSVVVQWRRCLRRVFVFACPASFARPAPFLIRSFVFSGGSGVVALGVATLSRDMRSLLPRLAVDQGRALTYAKSLEAAGVLGSPSFKDISGRILRRE